MPPPRDRNAVPYAVHTISVLLLFDSFGWRADADGASFNEILFATRSECGLRNNGDTPISGYTHAGSFRAILSIGSFSLAITPLPNHLLVHSLPEEQSEIIFFY